MLGEVAADLPHKKLEGRAFVLHIAKFFKLLAAPMDVDQTGTGSSAGLLRMQRMQATEPTSAAALTRKSGL